MKARTTNKLVRTSIKNSSLRQWEVAEKLGISESYFSKIIRSELPIEEQQELVTRINKLS